MFYLPAITHEVRLHPEVLRAQDLGHFKVLEILEEGSELKNLVGGVDKSSEKERRVSVLKLNNDERLFSSFRYTEPPI